MLDNNSLFELYMIHMKNLLVLLVLLDGQGVINFVKGTSTVSWLFLSTISGIKFNAH